MPRVCEKRVIWRWTADYDEPPRLLCNMPAGLSSPWQLLTATNTIVIAVWRTHCTLHTAPHTAHCTLTAHWIAVVRRRTSQCCQFQQFIFAKCCLYRLRDLDWLRPRLSLVVQKSELYGRMMDWTTRAEKAENSIRSLLVVARSAAVLCYKPISSLQTCKDFYLVQW